MLPPTIKVDAPNPAMHIEESPFRLNTEARPWVRASDHPRRASVTRRKRKRDNFHIALEEYTGPGKRAARFRALPSELLQLSAATPAELAALCDKTVEASKTAGALWELARDARRSRST